MNVTCLSGRMGADPQLKSTKSGKDVVNFSLAIKRPHVKDAFDWIDFEAWEHTARYIAQYASKGCHVEVVGEIRTEKYEMPDGSKRTAFKVRVQDCRVHSNGVARIFKDTELERAQRVHEAELSEFREAAAGEEVLPF